MGPDTAVLPTDWQHRLVKLQNPNTDLKVGWCLDLHDLAISKLAAGREKDWPFVAEMLHHQLINANDLLARLAQTALPDGQSRRIRTWIVAKSPDH